MSTHAHTLFNRSCRSSSKELHNSSKATMYWYVWTTCRSCQMNQALTLLFMQVFSKTWCPFSQKAKKLLDDSNIPYHTVEIDLQPNGADIQQALADLTGQKTVPNIFIKSTHIGGYVDLRKAFQSNKLDVIKEIRRQTFQ